MVMVAQGANMVLQLLGMIVLARLLTPDDYGLLAIVTVLMGIGALIRDFGMGTAALQETSLSQAQASNLFWTNAMLSAATAGILALCSPVIAVIFGDSRLLALVPVMASVLLVMGLQTQYQAMLARERRFASLAGAAIGSNAAGIFVGVTTALIGWGYWALAAQQMTVAVGLLTIYLLTTRWLPSKPARGVGSRHHIRAGAHYGTANVIGYAADNVDTIMIGLQWGSVALGNYNRAFALFAQPIAALFGPLTQVVVPTINRTRAEGGDPNALLLRVQSALVGLATWGLLVTAATAPWLIPLLIGNQWAAAVPLLQILAVGGVFKALSQINYWAYVASKQSRELLRSNLVTKPIQIALIVVAAFFGVTWVAWAFVLGRAISWPVNLIWLARTVGQRSSAAFWNGLRILTAGAIAFGITTTVLLLVPPMTNAWTVVIGIATASLVYFVVFALLPGGTRELRSILSLRSALLRR